MAHEKSLFEAKLDILEFGRARIYCAGPDRHHKSSFVAKSASMSIIDTESLEATWPSRELADSKDADRDFLAFHRPVSRPLYAFTSGHFPSHAISLPHSHPCIALHGCIVGPIELITPELKIPLEAGQFFLLPPHQVHSWCSVGNHTAATLGLLIDTERPGQWPEGSGIPECCERLKVAVRKPRFFSPVDDLDLHHAFWRAADLLTEESPQSRIAIHSSLWMLLSYLAERLDQPTVDRTSNEEAKRIRRVLLHHVYGSASLNQIARESRLSLTRAKHVFSTTYGCGIKEYLVQMKIFRAQRLLGDSRLTIQQISQRLGFSSPAYFSRLFRARTSESPQRFRKRLSGRGE